MSMQIDLIRSTNTNLMTLVPLQVTVRLGHVAGVGPIMWVVLRSLVIFVEGDLDDSRFRYVYMQP